MVCVEAARGEGHWLEKMPFFSAPKEKYRSFFPIRYRGCPHDQPCDRQLANSMTTERPAQRHGWAPKKFCWMSFPLLSQASGQGCAAEMDRDHCCLFLSLTETYFCYNYVFIYLSNKATFLYFPCGKLTSTWKSNGCNILLYCRILLYTVSLV